MQMFWFMPTHGDGCTLGIIEERRKSFRYYSQIASALDYLKYDGILIPTGHMFTESWVIAAGLAVKSPTLCYLIAVRPGVISPVYLARQTAALAELVTQNVAINIVVGGNQDELFSGGVFLSPAERYMQASEFMEIYNQALSKNIQSMSGKYYRIEANEFSFSPNTAVEVSLYSSGESEAGKEFAARYADTYLMWGNTPSDVADTIEDMRSRAARFDRKLRFGLRLHLIVRDTIELAWKEADSLLSTIPLEQQALAMGRIKREEAVAQRNIFNKHLGKHDNLEISPYLWAGVGLARGGALTALVGDRETVSQKIAEYQRLGVDTLIASGTPHLEEAYNVAHLLFPVIGR